MTETTPSKKQRILKACKWIFALLAVAFLIWYFIKNRSDFEAIQGINAGTLTIAMLLYCIYKIMLASLWHHLTAINGCAIGYGKAVPAYLYSIIGKYIPGKVFMLAGRIPYYEEEGAPVSKVTVCFFIENICTLLGAAMLFIVSLYFFPNDVMQQYHWIVLALIAAFFVCIHPKLINALLRIAGKIFKKELYIPMTYPQMLRAVLLFIANWLIAGTGFFMLVTAIYPDATLAQLPFCAGVWGLSAMAGILAIFAPSGIGVREGMIIACLSLIMPTEYTVVISVASRLWQTIPELLLAGGAFVVSRIRAICKSKAE